MASRSLRIGIVSEGPSAMTQLRELLAGDPDWRVELRQLPASSEDRAAPGGDDGTGDDVIVAFTDDALRVRSWSEQSSPLIAVSEREDEPTAMALLGAGACEVLSRSRLRLTTFERAVLAAVERATLRRRVGERQRELEAENHLLRKQRREIEAFHHTLSHELKTPLTSIREFVSLIADGVAGPVSDEQREYLEICRRGCDQLKRVTNDLIDLSRIDTGKFSLHTARVSVVDLVDEVIALEARRADRAGILLERAEVSPEDWAGLTADIDGDRVKQILINLIDNSLVHTSSGGSVRVSVCRARRDNAEAKPEESVEDEIVISVVDTGSGISPEDQGRVFERHFQGRRAPGAVVEGMGLGLSLCKELVELHGGRTWLESTPGVGSAFYITLPGRSVVPAERTVATP